MGRKSRVKRERKKTGLKRELRRHPMGQEIGAFLKKRGIETDGASGILYVVSLFANFLIHLSVKQHLELPVISLEEDRADKERIKELGAVLEYECRHLGIQADEIMNELVFPMLGNAMLMEPILKKVYDMLDTLIPSPSFRQTTETQIENAEFWGDSLAHREGREEEYFQTVKALFALMLVISRSALGEEMKQRQQERQLDEIKQIYRIEADDFTKLRRRASVFYKIAFAKYLSMVFQPLREEVDEKVFEEQST